MRSIVRRLDRDLDGIVSLEDFMKGVMPIHCDINYEIEHAKRKLAQLQLSEQVPLNKNIQKLFFEPGNQKFRRSDEGIEFVNRTSDAQKLGDSPFEVVQEVSEKNRASDISSLSVNNAMSWKEFLKSGNKMAMVYIDDSKAKSPYTDKIKNKTKASRNTRSTKTVRYKSMKVIFNPHNQDIEKK